MTSAWATVTASIIGVIGSIILFFLNKLRKENRDDHNMVSQAIKHLHDDVKEVSQKVDNHIDWHLTKKK